MQNKAISKFILHKLRNWSYVEIAKINLTVYSLMTQALLVYKCTDEASG